MKVPPNKSSTNKGSKTQISGCERGILLTTSFATEGKMKKILLFTAVAMYSTLPTHATTYFDTRALFASPSAPTRDLIAVNPQGAFDYIRVGTLSQSISATDLYVTFSVPISNSCARLNGFGSGSFPLNFFLQPFTDASLQTPLTGNSVDASFGIRALPDSTCITKFDNITLPSGSYIVLALGLLPQFVDRLNPWPLTVTAGGTWESVPPFCSGGAGINNCVAYSGTPYILITDVNPFPERAPLRTTYLDTRGLFVATSPAQDLNLVNPTDGGVTQDSSITLGTISTDIPGQSDYYLDFSAPFPNACATIVNNLQPSGTSFLNIAYFTSDGENFLGHDDVADNDIKTFPDGTCVAHFRALNARNAGTLSVLQVRHFDGGYLIPSFPLVMTSGGTWTGPLAPYCGLHCRHYNGTFYAQLSDNVLTALPSALSVSPLMVNFDRQIVGTPGPSKNVIIQNSGGGTLIPTITSSGDFSQTNNCLAGISAGQTCQITLIFIPSGLAIRKGTLSISNQIPPLNQNIDLQGFGTLGFPLKAATAYTAIISTVMGHHIATDADGNPLFYASDNFVDAYTGEEGALNCAPAISPCSALDKDGNQQSPVGYKNTQDKLFTINSYYTGGRPCYDDDGTQIPCQSWLFYEGHPGFDFPAKLGTTVYAPGRGVAFIPDCDPVTRRNDCTGTPSGRAVDGFNILAIDHGNGYSTWYLHMGDLEIDNESTTIPSELFQISVDHSIFQADLGVVYALNPKRTLKKVASSPSRGQYSVDANGIYTFSSADSGLGVLISYYYAIDLRVISCPGQPSVALKRGDHQLVSVTPDCIVGEVGNKAIDLKNNPLPLGAHLHFEVRKGLVATPTGIYQCALPSCVPIDPYGWRSTTQKDPYPFGPNIVLWNDPEL